MTIRYWDGTAWIEQDVADGTPPNGYNGWHVMVDEDVPLARASEWLASGTNPTTLSVEDAHGFRQIAEIGSITLPAGTRIEPIRYTSTPIETTTFRDDQRQYVTGLRRTEPVTVTLNWDPGPFPGLDESEPTVANWPNALDRHDPRLPADLAEGLAAAGYSPSQALEILQRVLTAPPNDATVAPSVPARGRLISLEQEEP